MLMLARFLAISVLTGSLASCIAVQPVLRVKPTGGLGSGVVFYLADLFHAQPSPFIITDVTVEEKQTEYQSIQIWSIHGEQALRSVVYGGNYKGLKQTQRARPLRRGTDYTVMIYTRTGAETFDITGFRINETGVVVPRKWW